MNQQCAWILLAYEFVGYFVTINLSWYKEPFSFINTIKVILCFIFWPFAIAIDADKERR